MGWMRRDAVTLVVCCTALFMNTLDATILNVALPSLGREFGATPAGLQWTVDGYILVRASLLFVCGAIADRYGRRRWFTIGLGIFLTGSIACAAAPNVGSLIAFRAVQSAGSAFMTPASLGIVANTFTQPRARAQALGIWSATTGLSMAAGPVLGGLLVQTVGWRSVFWVNVPVGLLAAAGLRRVGESKAGGAPRRFDLPGQLLLAAALATLTYALIDGPESGWGRPTTIGLLVVSGVCGWLFWEVERRSPHPVFEPRDFASPALQAAVVLAIVAFVALGGFLFFNTLYLQETRGYSPLVAGLLTVPTMATTLVFSPLAGRLTGTRGPRLPAAVAAGLIAAGAATLAVVITPTTGPGALLVGYLLLGCGFGLINPPLTNAAMAELPRERAGVAAATTSAARQVGMNLGVALVGSVILSADSFTTGMRYGYTLVTVLALGAVWVAARAFRDRPAALGTPSRR